MVLCVNLLKVMNIRQQLDQESIKRACQHSAEERILMALALSKLAHQLYLAVHQKRDHHEGPRKGAKRVRPVTK